MTNKIRLGWHCLLEKKTNFILTKLQHGWWQAFKVGLVTRVNQGSTVIDICCCGDPALVTKVNKYGFAIIYSRVNMNEFSLAAGVKLHEDNTYCRHSTARTNGEPNLERSAILPVGIRCNILHVFWKVFQTILQKVCEILTNELVLYHHHKTTMIDQLDSVEKNNGDVLVL